LNLLSKSACFDIKARIYEKYYTLYFSFSYVAYIFPFPYVFAYRPIFVTQGKQKTFHCWAVSAQFSPTSTA